MEAWRKSVLNCFLQPEIFRRSYPIPWPNALEAELSMPVVLAFLLIWILNVSAAPAAEIRASFAMESDPEFQIPAPVKIFTKGFKAVWLQALARPDADLQRRCAETLAQAHEFGFPGLIEARPRLREILKAEDTQISARFAAARALIVMDTRDAAGDLFDASQRYSSDLRQFIEPHLGRWKYQPIGAIWRERLTAKEVRHRDLLLAIEGAAQLGDTEAVAPLLKLVHDPLKSAPVRMAAAKAAGNIQHQGLESDAERLLTEQKKIPLVNRLCALSLIIQHDSEVARNRLSQAAVDPEPAVAAAALQRLLSLNPDLVLPLAEGAMNSSDPVVRQRGAEAFIARPTPERAVSLVRLLDDVHPTVRSHVREALFVLTRKPEYDAVLRPAFVKLLAAESWRGQEQSALLLGMLDHEPSAARFVELLESPREEVFTTAAWALRKLAIPDTLPAILAKAQRQTDLREKGGFPQAVDDQVVHLFEAMGLMKYAPAEPLFRKHIPKVFIYGEYSRGAAIWALGHLYEGKPDPELAKQISGRMQDVLSLPPELMHVQVMSAVSLGRMQAKSEAKEMKRLLTDPTGPYQPVLALRWALHRLTGETFPELIPTTISKTSWFLTPIDDTGTDRAP